MKSEERKSILEAAAHMEREAEFLSEIPRDQQESADFRRQAKELRQIAEKQPYGYWDEDNRCMYYNEEESTFATQGGNHVIPLFQ